MASPTTPLTSAKAREKLADRDLEMVRIEDLNVDHSYQRDFDQALAQSIAEGWDSSAMDPIIVSCRKDDSLWIVSGQHRAGGAKIAGEETILAVVHYGLTIEAEADLRIKGNTRRTDRPNESFKAKLRAGYPEAVAIAEILKGFGTRINPYPMQREGINGVATIEAIYRVDDGALLTRVLEMIKDAWDEVGGEYTTVAVLKAISFAISRHMSEWDRQHMIDVLRKAGPWKLDGKARSHQALVGGALWANYYRGMIELYNEKWPARKQIEARLSGTSKFASTASQLVAQEKKGALHGDAASAGYGSRKGKGSAAPRVRRSKGQQDRSH